MMRAPKLPTRSKSAHTFEVTELVGKKQVRHAVTAASARTALFRVFSVMLMAMVLLAGGVFASLTTFTAGSSTAHADIFDEAVCLTENKSGAWLGGYTSLSPSVPVAYSQDTDYTDGTVGPQAANPERLTNPDWTAEDGFTTEWTALELFGYYNPTYTVWVGATHTQGDEYVYTGTGGTDGLEIGPAATIDNPETNMMLSAGPADCLLGSAGGAFSIGAANTISYLPKLFLATSGEIYRWAVGFSSTSNESSPLAAFSEGIERIIVGVPGTDNGGLREDLFLEFLIPIIMIGALGIAYTGLIKRSSLRAAQGAGWMIGAAIAAFLFLSNPMWVPNTIDDVVSDVNGAISDGLVASDDIGSSMCSLPAGAPQRTERQVTCTIWYNTIYVPWVSGQFGVNALDMNPTSTPEMYSSPNTGENVSPAGSDAIPGNLSGYDDTSGEDIVPSPTTATDDRGVLQAFSQDPRRTLGTAGFPEGGANWAYYNMVMQANYEQGDVNNLSEVAFNQLAINNNDVWKGAGNALGNAFLSVIAVAGPGLLLIVTGTTLLIYQLTMMILIAFAPLFLLVGVAPGWGRRIALRWAEMVVGLLVKRIILMLFLLIYIRLYTILIQTPMDWFYQTALVAVLSIVALTQRERVVEMFSGMITFGGDQRIQDMNGQVSGGAKVAGAYLIGKSAAGARTVAQSARKTPSAVTSAKKSIRDIKERRDEKDFSREVGAEKKPTLAGGKKTVLNAAASAEAREKEAKVTAAGVAEQHRNITNPDDLNMANLTEAERAKMVGKDGKVDKKLADKWLNGEKARQLSGIEENRKKMEETVEERKRIQAENLSKKERDAKLKANHLEFNRLRSSTAGLQADATRIFGPAQPKEDGAAPAAAASTGSTAAGRTGQRAARRVAEEAAQREQQARFDDTFGKPAGVKPAASGPKPAPSPLKPTTTAPQTPPAAPRQPVRKPTTPANTSKPFDNPTNLGD